MSVITRRKFAGILGLMTAGGVLSARAQARSEHGAPAKAPVAAKPAPAPAKPAVDSPIVSPKPPTAPASVSVTAPPPFVDRSIADHETIWKDLMEGNKRFADGKPRTRD